MGARIGICGIFQKHQFGSGVYSFFENLLRGIAEVRRAPEEIGAFDVDVFHGSRGLPWTDSQFRYRQVPDRFGRIPAEARVGCYDSRGLDGVLFPNTFTPPIVRAKRAVTVIHDLQYLHLPEHWPLAKRLWLRACHATTLRRCDAVVAISQAVKEDILKQYGHRWESRVHAIWNPVSLERFNQPAERTFTNGRPYILSAAVDRPQKNLSTLIRAFAILRERFPEHCLVLTGQLRADDLTWRRKSDTSEVKLPSAADLVRELGLSQHVVLTGFIPDTELGALYRGASLFVLPSLFEGFGMPAVEALALETPALITDLPVLREVTLNGAEYIENPQNAGEIADRMGDLLRLGDAARPSPTFCHNIRQCFAPATIAKQYLSIIMNGN